MKSVSFNISTNFKETDFRIEWNLQTTQIKEIKEIVEGTAGTMWPKGSAQLVTIASIPERFIELQY
jgi:hypothetical protein